MARADRMASSNNHSTKESGSNEGTGSDGEQVGVGHGSSSTAEVRQVLFHNGIRLYYSSVDLSRDPCKGSIPYVY